LTSRERLTAVLGGQIPDHVPVMPDLSNMVPARLTKKPFWDIYLYQDPPLWRAYIDCVKYFGIDSLWDAYYISIPLDPAPVDPPAPEIFTAAVFKSEDRLVTQKFEYVNGRRKWHGAVDVYYKNNPPNHGVDPHVVRLPIEPDRFELVEGIKTWPSGEALLKILKTELGDHGIVGVACGTSSLIGGEREICDYFDNPQKYYDRRDWALEYYEKLFAKILTFSCKPDFISTGASGTLINQTPQMFRELGLPIVKKMTALAKKHGFFSHIHSCGPEAEMVKICAEETDLTVIDPLEIPPMGDCDLKELKRLYGDRLVLKGNLHTTKVMLHGSVNDVVEASKKAIDDAAAKGRFILSSGDQCGRDTPDENIMAMVETAKAYGRY
jgi:uroporphyrinogen decarboxylase